MNIELNTSSQNIMDIIAINSHESHIDINYKDIIMLAVILANPETIEDNSLQFKKMKISKVGKGNIIYAPLVYTDKKEIKISNLIKIIEDYFNKEISDIYLEFVDRKNESFNAIVIKSSKIINFVSGNYIDAKSDDKEKIPGIKEYIEKSFNIFLKERSSIYKELESK